MSRWIKGIVLYGLLYGWLFVGISLFFIPHPKISKEENRKLAGFPSWSIESFLHRKFQDSLRLFLADHFHYRQALISFAKDLHQLKGIQIEKVKVYQNNNLLDENLTQVHPQDSALDTLSTKKTQRAYQDTSLNSNPIVETVFLDSAQQNGVGRIQNNVFICNGKAFQFFGGNSQMAKAFAKIADRYASQLAPIRVYTAIVPSNAEFYLPLKYQKMKRSECANIDATHQALQHAIPVNICDEIYQHLDEYLYFNTDHHWTGLGAYYGYVAWCKAANVEPVPLNQMKRKVIRNYYGTMYQMTKDPELAQNKDSVEYFVSDVKTQTWYYLENQLNKPYKGTYLVEFATSATAYGVFLGADYPLMHIQTSVKNNKNLLFIKNSFGNPFATFLVNHFENIYVVDYRYYHIPFNNLIKEKKITDIIFLMGVFSTNTPSHIQKVNALLTHEKKEKKPSE